MKKFAHLLALCCAFACLASAQGDKSTRPSPPAKASCSTNGASITIDYSSPRMKGRKIYGGLVPFGQIWRTGANEATTFDTSADVTVGGQTVPAGSYTIFTVPEADKWTLVISKKTGEWGTDYPGENNDLLRLPMKVSKTSGPVENFTIAFDQSGDKCVLNMDWENTRASVDVAKK